MGEKQKEEPQLPRKPNEHVRYKNEHIKKQKRIRKKIKENMSKLSKAYNEINRMNEIAERDQWVNQIHPLVKLFLTVFYVVLVVSYSKYNLTGVILMAIYPVCTFTLGNVSIKECLYRLRILLPLVCIVGIFNPIFDRAVIGHMGDLAVTEGMVSMVTLMIKGVLALLASYLLIATTTIEKICGALRLLHVPTIIVTQILLTYRYISVLLKEGHTVIQAYELRAPGQKGVHIKVWGSLLGQLLLRTMDRADNVYASMTLRGYQGEFQHALQGKCGGKDYLYLVVWGMVFVSIKFLV